MDRTSKIYVAGHCGLLGSALVRRLRALGFEKLVLRTRKELDLTNRDAVKKFFSEDRPRYVFLAAAQVGGILANDTYPVPFIRENLLIALNVIHEAYQSGVERLIFLGSSCVYPKHAPQPIKEEALLSGPLEPTNRPYALAKIAGIELCAAYNRQFGTQFIVGMPTNLYGPNDNYDLHDSHVVPALIKKMHEAKQSGAEQVSIWGTGQPRREFLYSDDAAEACIFLMDLPDENFGAIANGDQVWPTINIGCGEDLTVGELSSLVAETVGFDGDLVFDPSKPDGTPRKLLDSCRLRALGWNARVPLREGLALTYQAYLKERRSIYPSRSGAAVAAGI